MSIYRNRGYILRSNTNRTRFFSLSLKKEIKNKKNKADRLQGRKAFHRRAPVRTSVGVEGSTNRIENPVKRTTGAFAVKERARCRKKLVVAACRPDQAVKVLITSRRMVSMMLGPTLYIPHPNLTGHPSVALPSASIAQFADTSLSIGWVGGPSWDHEAHERKRSGPDPR